MAERRRSRKRKKEEKRRGKIEMQIWVSKERGDSRDHWLRLYYIIETFRQWLSKTKENYTARAKLISKSWYAIEPLKQPIIVADYIIVCVCVCVSECKVNTDCGYPKDKCSMHGYLIQNIPGEENIYFSLKSNNFRNSIPCPH